MENLEYYNDICIDPPALKMKLKSKNIFQIKLLKKKDFYIYSYFKDVIKEIY